MSGHLHISMIQVLMFAARERSKVELIYRKCVAVAVSLVYRVSVIFRCCFFSLCLVGQRPVVVRTPRHREGNVHPPPVQCTSKVSMDTH